MKVINPGLDFLKSNVNQHVPEEHPQIGLDARKLII